MTAITPPHGGRCPKARTLKTASATFCIALAALCFTAQAGEVAVPVAPPPAHFDTESVTNAPVLRPMMERARLLRASVSLWATPSNNVEIAFGTSRNADGVLLPGDESLAFGWENGAWFLASPTNRIRSIVFPEVDARSLSFQLRVRDDGSPVSLAISDAIAGGLFPDLTNDPPTWLFSRNWDTVRLTVRGTDERNEELSVRLDTDAGVLILR